MVSVNYIQGYNRNQKKTYQSQGKSRDILGCFGTVLGGLPTAYNARGLITRSYPYPTCLIQKTHGIGFHLTPHFPYPTPIHNQRPPPNITWYCLETKPWRDGSDLFMLGRKKTCILYCCSSSSILCNTRFRIVELCQSPACFWLLRPSFLVCLDDIHIFLKEPSGGFLK